MHRSFSRYDKVTDSEVLFLLLPCHEYIPPSLFFW
jgi:hypothetical protein